jgi:hypothetical protein
MDSDSPFASESNLLRSAYPQPSGTATFKLDEGFSEDPRGQDDSDLATTREKTSGFEEWVMAQSEDDRAGECHKKNKPASSHFITTLYSLQKANPGNRKLQTSPTRF